MQTPLPVRRRTRTRGNVSRRIFRCFRHTSRRAGGRVRPRVCVTREAFGLWWWSIQGRGETAAGVRCEKDMTFSLDKVRTVRLPLRRSPVRIRLRQGLRCAARSCSAPFAGCSRRRGFFTPVDGMISIEWCRGGNVGGWWVVGDRRQRIGWLDREIQEKTRRLGSGRVRWKPMVL